MFLSGQEITGKPGSISYMLQKDLLLPHKKILDNVALPLVLRGESKQAAREKAQPYFAQFGLEGTEAQYPAQLSGGMRQRAALLRTFLGLPRCGAAGRAVFGTGCPDQAGDPPLVHGYDGFFAPDDPFYYP